MFLLTKPCTETLVQRMDSIFIHRHSSVQLCRTSTEVQYTSVVGTTSKCLLNIKPKINSYINWTACMDKYHLSISAPCNGRCLEAQLVTASYRNSEDPCSNLGYISMSIYFICLVKNQFVWSCVSSVYYRQVGVTMRQFYGQRNSVCACSITTKNPSVVRHESLLVTKNWNDKDLIYIAGLTYLL